MAQIPMAESRHIFSSIPRKHKKQKAINKGTYERSRICQVYQLDMSDPVIQNIPRAGVVFYTFINNELHICFGRDRRTGELTDFGGGKKRNENPIKCAIREGNEESRCAFSKITVNQIQGFYCLYSSKMLIIFIPTASPNNIDVRCISNENFTNCLLLNNKQKNDRRYNEISEIVWLNENQLNNLFSPRPSVQLFAKVRRFIYSCSNLSQDINLLKQILKSVVNDNSQFYKFNVIKIL